MTSDPQTVRHTGLQRLRMATAAVGMAAVVGTSALTWSIAAGASTAEASAESTDATDSTTDSGDSSTDSSTDSAPTVESDDSGGADASSGAS